MRSPCHICWVVSVCSFQMEDHEDYTATEKKELANKQKMKIAADIVDHHPEILAEIDRLLGKDAKK